MRWHLKVVVALVVLGSAPGWPQFQDLIQEAQRLALKEDRTVTLSVSSAPLKDALAKLAGAAQATLSCAPALAEKKVTFTAREWSARQVGEGLARAIRGRWRKDGDGFVLEPTDPLDVLTAEEAARQLRLSLMEPGMPQAPAPWQVEGRMVELFAPAQLEAMAADDGIPFTALAPQQQQLLAREGTDALSSLSGLHGQAGRMGEVTVSLQRSEREVISATSGAPEPIRKRAVQETLMIRGPGWSTAVPIRRPQQ